MATGLTLGMSLLAFLKLSVSFHLMLVSVWVEVLCTVSLIFLPPWYSVACMARVTLHLVGAGGRLSTVTILRLWVEGRGGAINFGREGWKVCWCEHT